MAGGGRAAFHESITLISAIAKTFQNEDF